MKKTFLVMAMAIALAMSAMAPALADSDSVANVNENANCLGAERAERNAVDGDRQKGAFGPLQAATAQDKVALGGVGFGTWLNSVWRTPDC